MSSVIEDVTARKIFNSRGEETVEIDIVTTAGFGRASAPAGASKGKGPKKLQINTTRCLALG